MSCTVVVCNDRGPSSSSALPGHQPWTPSRWANRSPIAWPPRRSVAPAGWFCPHHRSARNGSCRNQGPARRQGSRALRSALVCSAWAGGWRDQGTPTSAGMEPRDIGSQSAPRRYSPMQRFRTAGCSGEEGDREAHQGQPCQTGGCKNRKRLDHRQLQHGQNLKQSLRPASVPAWYRCNSLMQRRQGSGSWPAPPRLSPIDEALMASGLHIAAGLEDQLRLADQSSLHNAVSRPSSAMGVDLKRQRGPHQRRLKADDPGSLQTRPAWLCW